MPRSDDQLTPMFLISESKTSMKRVSIWICAVGLSKRSIIPRIPSIREERSETIKAFVRLSTCTLPPFVASTRFFTVTAIFSASA